VLDHKNGLDFNYAEIAWDLYHQSGRGPGVGNVNMDGRDTVLS
jgi:hypothetical protein